MTADTILPLKLDRVSFEAGGKRLIKDVTYTFEAGPRTIILGPNGAGKSLLLRLCHGLLKPSGWRRHLAGQRRGVASSGDGIPTSGDVAPFGRRQRGLRPQTPRHEP